MQTIYRLNTQELTIDFVRSVKTLLPNQDVEITVKPLAQPDGISDQDWLRAAGKSSSFAFLHDEGENIYSITDGTPID